MPDDNPTNKAISTKGRWKKAFLDGIRRGIGFVQSCSAASVDPHTVYDAKKRDASFAQQFQEAIDESIDNLQAEAVRRAGKTSDFLCWKLLQGRLRSKYGDSGGPTQQPQQINLNITLRPEEPKK